VSRLHLLFNLTYCSNNTDFTSKLFTINSSLINKMSSGLFSKESMIGSMDLCAMMMMSKK
jgi:hypothetical protein